MIARLAGLALAGLVTAGCSSDGAAPPDPPEGGYFLVFEAEPGAAGELEVTGTTNLPDHTEVDLSATRSSIEDGESTARGTSAARETATVAGGTFSMAVTLDEGDLLAAITPGHAVETISPVVAVCVVVKTGTDSTTGSNRQPDEGVREALGESGKQLEGAMGAFVVGELTDKPATWLGVKGDVEVAPPLDEITDAQGSPPKVAAIDTFCA